MEMVNAFRTSRIVLSAYELGIFTFIKDRKLTSIEIAEAMKMNRRSTDRFMNALVSIGLLKKSDELFSNTAFSSKHLVKDEPGFLAGLSHQVHLWRTWSTLTDAVKAGTTVAGEGPIGERGEEWLSSFIAAMHSRGVPQSTAVIHINSPEENKLLIRKCYDALNPHGQLVILDHFMNDDRTEPVAGAIFALNMLVGTQHGDTYTENEVISWMLDTGLKDISVKVSSQGTNLLIGVK